MRLTREEKKRMLMFTWLTHILFYWFSGLAPSMVIPTFCMGIPISQLKIQPWKYPHRSTKGYAYVSELILNHIKFRMKINNYNIFACSYIIVLNIKTKLFCSELYHTPPKLFCSDYLYSASNNTKFKYTIFTIIIPSFFLSTLFIFALCFCYPFFLY